MEYPYEFDCNYTNNIYINLNKTKHCENTTYNISNNKFKRLKTIATNSTNSTNYTNYTNSINNKNIHYINNTSNSFQYKKQKLS